MSERTTNHQDQWHSGRCAQCGIETRVIDGICNDCYYDSQDSDPTKPPSAKHSNAGNDARPASAQMRRSIGSGIGAALIAAVGVGSVTVAAFQVIVLGLYIVSVRGGHSPSDLPSLWPNLRHALILLGMFLVSAWHGALFRFVDVRSTSGKDAWMCFAYLLAAAVPFGAFALIGELARTMKTSGTGNAVMTSLIIFGTWPSVSLWLLNKLGKLLRRRHRPRRHR